MDALKLSGCLEACFSPRLEEDRRRFCGYFLSEKFSCKSLLGVGGSRKNSRNLSSACLCILFSFLKC